MDYTLDMLDREDTYHSDVIRSRLTRNIATTFDQVNNEFIDTLAACIPMASEGMSRWHAHRSRIEVPMNRLGWVKISILPTMQQIICRASSRIFVGTPLCVQPFSSLCQWHVLISRRQESWLSETSPEFCGRCDESSLYSLSVSEAPQAVRLSPLLHFIALMISSTG